MGFSLGTSRLVSVGLASIIAVGVIGFSGVAMAEGGDGSGAPSTANPGARQHHPIKVGLEDLLKDSGVTRDEFKQGASDGLTVAGIIDTYGDISAAQAKQNALDRLSDALDKAVADGKLKQAAADRIEAAAPGLLDRILASVPGSHRGGEHRPGKIAKDALQTVADVLNIDVATLRDDLKGGKTIAEVAGPQTQAVIDALDAKANAAIEKAVADGKLPADKEDAAKAKALEAITKFVNEGHPKAHPGAAPNGGNGSNGSSANPGGRFPGRGTAPSSAPNSQ
jgi:hypothetical protein